MHISIMLVFWSLVLLFGIVWCWRSISCFRLLASLPYMSIGSGVVVAVALQKVDRAPHAEAGTQRHNEGLQHIDRTVEKCHIFVLLKVGGREMPPPGNRSAWLRKHGIPPVLCGFPSLARWMDACHCKGGGSSISGRPGGEPPPLWAGCQRQAVNRPESRGTRVMPMRATPPPAINCFMPWLFAHVR